MILSNGSTIKQIYRGDQVMTHPANQLSPLFIRTKGESGKQALYRKTAQTLFFRLGEEDRLSLTSDLIDAWERHTPLRGSAAAAIFREAWDSEPYLGGIRLGSYLTECFRRKGYDVYAALQALVGDWGYQLMTPKEKRALTMIKFPKMVYRGGVGDPGDVEYGVSWTLDLEVAKFYATKWPKRFGDQRPPVVLSALVEREDVFAFLQGRDEHEVLIPHVHDLVAPLEVVTL